MSRAGFELFRAAMTLDIDVEDQWRQVLEDLELSSAELLQISPYDIGRRVYRYDDRIYKIRIIQLDESAHLRKNNYENEYQLLRICSELHLDFVPRAVAYRHTERYEVLELEYFDGIVLSEYKGGCVPELLWAIFIAISRLSLAGISHNDLRPQNILVDKNFKIAVIDFDQAARNGVFSSFISGLLGVSLQRKGNKMYGSYLTIIKNCVKQILPSSLLFFIRKVRKSGDISTLPSLPENASNKLKLIRDAWQLGQMSDANAPGAFVSYYSLTEDGYSFPGERPWRRRWESLSSITEYDSKTILELGCNMGLLSTFLLKEKGVAAAFATDVDAEILKAAQLVAKAYGVSPTFTRQDFDSSENWEEILDASKPDIVFALNVLNWVKDKERLLRFLGRYQEVIFEGHDTVEIEMERFKRVGFDHVSLVTISERNRPLLHCRK